MKLNAGKLKSLRKRTGLSAQEFAFVCDIPVGTYFTYEAGRRNPKIENLQVIADRLKTTIDVLVSDDDEYIIKSRVEVKKTKEQIAKERVIIDRYVLRSRRKQLRIKADYIANKIGISVTRYREYENGYGNPTRAMARIMCDVLDLKFYELVIE